MTQNDEFTWKYEICDIVRWDEYNTDYNVNSDKLRSAINKYGIDIKDQRHDTLIQIIFRCRLSFSYKQVCIVLSFKPNLLYEWGPNEYFIRYNGLWMYSDIETQILQVLLHNDVNFDYNKYPVSYQFKKYDNLLNLVCFFIKRDGFSIHEKRYDLLKNHMNKGISLFELMKDELEENNKKQRFY